MTASLRAPTAEFEIAAPRVDASRYDFVIRDAKVSDNEGLIALAAACPMVGEISLRIDRGPSFFALNRLEGERWRVGVATGHDRDGGACDREQGQESQDETDPAASRR